MYLLIEKNTSKTMFLHYMCRASFYLILNNAWIFLEFGIFSAKNSEKHNLI